MSVKVRYKGAEILNLDTSTEASLSTSGQYCEDDIVIENTLDNISDYLIHETGLLSIHRGMNYQYLDIPVSDNTFDHYFVKYKAVKSWLLSDNGWDEQSGLKFTGATSTGSVVFWGVASTDALRPTQTIDTKGISHTAAEVYQHLQRSTVSGNISMSSVNPDSRPTIIDMFLKLDLGSNNYVCTPTFGLTYEYELWGWNDV